MSAADVEWRLAVLLWEVTLMRRNNALSHVGSRMRKLSIRLAIKEWLDDFLSYQLKQ